jgi:hypothetical protein
MEDKNLFNDLTFEQHRFSTNGMCAKKTFDNKYTISVVTGEGFYGDINENDFSNSTFEVAVFDPNGDFVRLHEHDDVIGLRTSSEVEELMIATRDNPSMLQVEDATDS